ncbi:hypothetical protein [Staphylococcus pseudoxylosus]|uniref:hypothetical protein n=1 Tax=Staphylococcus pseudoxylosus TaxID=2282419 RepID=UPI000D1D7EAE|nr:hypothetical protein [Staphylococcus pseudoxylosus]MBM2657542.1 hypothetical protein [Staphylococcus pseudoxylosus]MEB5782384.1 hypothetical protein [Staphylococcus pseudoxylosus]PTI83622.1 hypothetical protein BU098_01690 [Staphylococcus xylosus]
MVKKEFNLPQLIEWAWANNVRDEKFKIKDRGVYVFVEFDSNGNFHSGHGLKLSKADTFIVEVEDEETQS